MNYLNKDTKWQLPVTFISKVFNQSILLLISDALVLTISLSDMDQNSRLSKEAKSQSL